MEQHYSFTALADGCFYSCFFSERAFFERTKDDFTEEHSHASYELLFIVEGEGNQWIEGVPCPYRTGDVFVFAPFVPHAHQGKKGEVRVSLRFDPKNPPSDITKGKKDASSLSLLRKKGWLYLENAKDLHRLLAMLKDNVSQGGKIASGGLMSAILSFVFQKGKDGASPREKKAGNSATEDMDERRFLIDQFFDRLVNRNSSIEELCSQVHLSPTQLSRQVKEMYGVSFKQKHTAVRLAYIKYFLKHTDLPIHVIAAENGFADTANFSLFFKKNAGESPSAYRKREQEK